VRISLHTELNQVGSVNLAGKIKLTGPTLGLPEKLVQIIAFGPEGQTDILYQ
jgi:hypothetical protein